MSCPNVTRVVSVDYVRRHDGLLDAVSNGVLCDAGVVVAEGMDDIEAEAHRRVLADLENNMEFQDEDYYFSRNGVDYAASRFGSPFGEVMVLVRGNDGSSRAFHSGINI